ncbi:MAG: hypothetical protein H6Q81_359 [Deltaproteobacteria bacterium]|nr:hypothetical protein [Deltaproteobacteria bacterium]
MKRTLPLICAVLLVASLAFAGAPNTYQVTGPVLELRDDVIVVQKGQDKWEIARGKDTKVTGDLKVGSKVEGKGNEEEITPRPAPSSA